MDSYAIYTRRIKALNQGTQAKFFVMPLSACIEQGTLVQICGFELFKEEKDVTEEEWRDYFLSAPIPDHTAYKTLDNEVRSLCMDTSLQDAESRLSRLMREFYEIVDHLNMEDVVQVEPKKVVGYWVEALRPPAFKAVVKDQLGRQAHKQPKANIQVFLKWLRGELESFMRFEAHIANPQPQPKSAPKVRQQQITTAAPKPSPGTTIVEVKSQLTPISNKMHVGAARMGKVDPIMLIRSVLSVVIRRMEYSKSKGAL
ncbi:hypothetical protein PHMEG_00013170 [Phytophthora megakarya]|uniref:Uncharacterized protein n=1 Tax=Phytophthora megakarya TaxID=4795 RepID=A0A225W6Y7_9STRA|nr:hypothetical protein PHMEG_00013170 [Phytophthora megakarya]